MIRKQEKKTDREIKIFAWCYFESR